MRNPVFLKLKDLLSARSKLLTQLNGILTYLKELKLSNPPTIHKLMEKAHKAAIEGLKKSILEIEKQLKQLVQQDERVRKNYQLLLSVPGGGHLTARTSSGAPTTLLSKSRASNWVLMPVWCPLSTKVASV